MEEIWKDIPGYEGLYQVSSFGDVKSLGRIMLNRGKYPFLTKEKLLNTTNNKKGYLNVYLTKNKKKRTFAVHQLVAMAFLNHIPDGMNVIVNHIDNNKLNNHFSNLELVSNRYNSSCHKTNPGVKILKDRNKKFQVQITINYRNITIGYFYTLEEANRAYQLASQNVSKYNGNNKEFRELIKTLYHV